MVQVNAIGDTCPIPVVKAKKAIKEITGKDTVEVLVDNEIAVKNLSKMASSMGFEAVQEKLSEKEYKVTISVDADKAVANVDEGEYEMCSIPAGKKKMVCVFGTNKMGEGSDELGATLMKGFIYALRQQEQLPDTMLFYNGGAKLTCEGSDSLEDLNALKEAGVEILTCGTCLNYYGLSEQLKVGEVTNMYVIAEKMTQADLIVKP